MGLGKTLSLLALVCLSLDGFDERELPDDHPRATLIVLRLSSTAKVEIHAIGKQFADFTSNQCVGTPNKDVSSRYFINLTELFVMLITIHRHIRSGQIRYLVYHGPNRQRVQQAFGRHYDIVFTTYETLQRDAEAGNRLQDENWFRVVLDEGSVKFSVMQALMRFQ